jgi:hypothetical protein
MLAIRSLLVVTHTMAAGLSVFSHKKATMMEEVLRLTLDWIESTIARIDHQA